MAFSMAARLLMRNGVLKSELLLKTLPKASSNAILAGQYIQALRDMKNQKSYLEDASELMQFPMKVFQRFPKSVLKSMIDETFNLINEKDKVKSAEIYNNVISSYMRNKIHFNIHDILREMTENKIAFDEDTYSNIIRYFCGRGEMSSLQHFLEKMKSENMPLLMEDKMKIITGYIMSGQPEKSKIFIKEDELDENSIEVLIAEAKGYAAIGDISSVTNILNKIEENKLIYPPRFVFIIYRLLIEAHVPESSLDKIYDLLKSVASDNKYKFIKTIVILNRNEFFNTSANLVEKFIDIINYKTVSLIIMSFNTPDCPVNTYKKVLKLLMDRTGRPSADSNIFSCMNFDDAFEFGMSEIDEKNRQIICTSLINKAINDKSITSIESALQFTLKSLTLIDINLILQYTFIKFMLESGMVSNCQEILDLFPKYKIHLLSVILMHNLCHGDFDGFNSLRVKYPYIKNVNFVCKWGYVSNEIMQKVSKSDISRLPREANKFFSTSVVNLLLKELIKKKIIESSKNGNLDEIKESVELAKNFNVTLDQPNFNYLINIMPEHAEILNSLNIIPK